MIAQSVAFPMPFGKMDFISLIEPNGESETELHFVHRLYLVTPFAAGGNVLLTQRTGRSMKKSDLLPRREGA